MPPRPLPPAEPMKLAPLAEIARGGMGSVELVRVLDGRLAGEAVAIKRLHSSIAQDPEFVSMFLDEAWMTAALDHPNVMRVAAWGNDERGMFLACELVQGVSLARLLKEAKQNQEPFAERTCAYIASQICGGLTAAHGLVGTDGKVLGLVHRDLTPGNVLVSFDGLVKIVDFGIAKAEERITHTRTGMLKGKPAYMAPEQARGGKVDARADIFSFGVLLYELLAGRKPWMAKGAFDVMMEISSQPPPDLGELRKGLNPEFVAIVHKCLEKKPDARFSNAEEIAAAFDGWRHKKGFAIDDQESLANFVKRNSAPQIKWFEDALKGEIERAAAPTFKELEEQIDAAREGNKRKTAPPMRPAAGRAAPPPPPAAGRATPPPPPASGRATPPPRPTAPQPASERAPAPQPAPEAAILPQPIAAQAAFSPQPIAAQAAYTPQPVAHSAIMPQPSAHSAVMPQPSAHSAVMPQPSAHSAVMPQPSAQSAVMPQPIAVRPASVPPPASGRPTPQPSSDHHPSSPPPRLLGVGGTEFMAQSPFAEAVRATLPKLNEIAAAAAAAKGPAGPPPAAPALAAGQAGPWGAEARPSAPAAPATPTVVKPRRSRAALIAVVIAIALLGGGAAAWLQRDRIGALFGAPARTAPARESVPPPATAPPLGAPTATPTTTP